MRTDKTMRITAKTDKGFRRRENQDRYVAGKLANGVCFGFVCDGMGGAKGGSVASSMLCKMLEECLFIENDNRAIDMEKVTLDAIDTACREIFRRSIEDTGLKGMGTTVSGITVLDGKAVTYNIGDSRVYILRDGLLTQVTEDHSVVQTLYRQGSITEREMMTHPQKNLITRAVGVRKEVDTDITELNLKKGDRILCASDGLTNFITVKDLTVLMSDENFFSIPQKLIDRALINNSSDNITAVVMEY